MHWQTISQHIRQVTGDAFHLETCSRVGGGCINTAYHLQGGGRDYFVKLNRADRHAMFVAEAAGLTELANANAVRVPKPICSGVCDHQAYLVLEFITFHIQSGTQAMRRLGEQLAQLHRYTRPQFGWQRDNTIGSTPQLNPWTSEWIAFWREQRLAYQLRLAAAQGMATRALDKGEQVQNMLEALFFAYQPVASVLHGDLWGGNVGVTDQAQPVIFDPAVYYGDRETDLAMTELFGGFTADFYASYRATWPLDAGYALRKTLYNLYHVLNHFNLFGGGYATQAEAMMDRLLAEI
jgi:fructosamine-3-kinase